jgi:1-acyl-sn-glycerol-3-phosphate acyltransferase
VSALVDPLWLDGIPGEALAPPDAGPACLGADPLVALTGASNPFFERLDRLLREDSSDPAVAPPSDEAASAPGRPRRRWMVTPSVSEVDPGEPSDLLDRWFDDDVRRRLQALAHLAHAESGYDRFGFSPAAFRRAFPFFHALHRRWFRVRSEGHEHIPREGPAILVANHGGLLPFDGAMTVVDVLLHTDPPRLVRSIVDRWAGTLPWVNVFFARTGQVVGTRENFFELLSEGQLVLVFPEGMNGIRKPVTQRYRLQRFHVGFIELALRMRVPLVPVAIVGSDDQAPILFDLAPLARRFGLPTFPVTPTFPWLGPLGLVPYPVPYRMVYGPPLHLHERFGPEDAEDVRLVQHLTDEVRRTLQALLDRRRR